MVLKNKKAALEMSMTTVITIVLSVVFLILGLTLLRSFYQFQTDSITSISDQTLKQINSLYLAGEGEATGIQVQLGSDKTAKIRAGTDSFGIGLVANTQNNAPITIAGANGTSSIQFEISLDPTNMECVQKNSVSFVNGFFKTPLNARINAQDIYQSTGGVAVLVNIPPSTIICSQGVLVRAWDYTANSAGALIGQTHFTIQVLRKLPFT